MIRTESLADLTTERTPLLVRKRVPASSAASTVSVASSSTQRNAPRSRTPLFLSISYASTSGILSGMCLIFAKSGVELLLISIHGSNQFWQWQAWMLVLGLVGFALLQLWYLHRALKLADPTIVCPCKCRLSSAFPVLNHNRFL
jgi:magnesium transporter